ncbi:MAG: PKD domain-containing protein [Bacteroidota bacterium]
MMKKILYIITVVLIGSLVSLQTKAQESFVYAVKRMSFNTDAFSEISPVIVKDSIIFCSDRRFSWFKDRTAFDGHRLYNIYMADRKDTLPGKTLKELKSERSFLFNNGPLCFAPDGKTVYFTSEDETGIPAKKKDYKNHSGIFIADLSGTNLISLRPFKYNNPQYEVGQPSISSNGKFLFFASDMPGGQGGSDLYYCELIDGEWSVPVNLGPEVNSSGTENNPYLHSSGKLFFTSNRAGGIGKLDIYYTSSDNSAWDDPVLLPEPVNSTFDDFAFVAEDSLNTGYFSSNRLGSDDIYEFTSSIIWKAPIIRKASCDSLQKNYYCYRFLEENAVELDSVPFRYEWKFGDGNMADGPVVEHCYSGPGTYLVQLDVVNLVTGETIFNEKNDTLIVKDIEQPYISGPDTINIGQQIMLSADSTNLPGWKIAQYYWNFGDETIALGKEVDKTYFKPGTFNIQLIVSTEPEPGGIAREGCVSKNIFVIGQP